MGWMPLLVLAGVMVAAALLVGGSVGVILVFAAVLLVLDRAIGFSGWGLEEPSGPSLGWSLSAADLGLPRRR